MDYPDDIEGVESDVMDDFEQMPELIRDDDEDSFVATCVGPSSTERIRRSLPIAPSVIIGKYLGRLQLVPFSSYQQPLP